MKQIEAIERIRSTMNAEARRLGETIIELERRLDRTFATAAISEEEFAATALA